MILPLRAVISVLNFSSHFSVFMVRIIEGSNSLAMNRFVLFLLFYVAVLGQGWNRNGFKNGVIYGQVVDSVTRAPMPYANVFVYNRRDSLVGGSLTDKKGWFKVEGLPAGVLKVKIDFLGYHSYQRFLRITPLQPEIDLGKLMLKPKDIQLQEIEIIEEKPRVEVQIDRIVYDPSKDIGVQGGDATDVLRRVPYLSVDNEGRVTIRGNENVRIFINGKPSLMFLTNPEDALRALPADQIEKVEVITVPSAKYDAEGSAGIVNIILKKQQYQGHSGSIDVGIGNLTGNLNGNLGWKWERWAIQFQLGGRYRYRGDGYTKYYYRSGSTEISQDGVYYPKRGGGRANLGIEYEITPTQKLELNLGAHGFQFIRESQVNIYATGLQPYTRYTENPMNRLSIEAGLGYHITRTRTEWRFLGLYESGWNNERYSLLQIASLDSLNRDERGLNTGNTRNGQFQVDNTYRLNEEWHLESGLKGTWRGFYSDYAYELFNSQIAEYQSDSNRSSDFGFSQSIYAAYTQISYKGEPLQLTTGIRYELTLNQLTHSNTQFSQQYENWVPNFSIGYKLDRMKMIRFNYGFRIQRPFYRELNPYVDASDPRNQSRGNPDLLPELTHSFELGLPPLISLFARLTDQIITDYTVSIDSGVTLTMPVNGATRTDYGISLFFQKRFFKKKLAIMLSGDLFWSQIQGLGQTNEGWQYFLRTMATYNITQRLSLEMMAFFNSNRITLQGYRPVFNINRFSFLYYLDKKKKLAFRGFVTNPFNPYYEFQWKIEGEDFYQEQANGVAFRQFGIGLRYQFGELNARMRQGRTGVGEMMEESY